ncbi:MAG: hypothetical protein U0229_08460 [Anaeromyxobacter sp.]
MLRLLIAGALASVVPAVASAYPITPRSLWIQVEGAERIVLARVESKHRLRVVETWKGPHEEVLAVSSSENVICPAPGRFEVDKLVIAFLAHGRQLAEDDDGRWHPYGLSYGLVYTDDVGVSHFRRLALAALELQRRGNVSDDERIAWLLDAASHAATRWDGLHDLEDPFIRMVPPDRRPRSLASKLTHEQRAGLARAFVADPGSGARISDLLPFLWDVQDPSLDATIVELLDRAVKAEEVAWWVGFQLRPVARWFAVDESTIPENIWSLEGPAVREAWRALRARLPAQRLTR